MVSRNFDHALGEWTFDYGGYAIHVDVSVKYDYGRPSSCVSHGKPGSGYYQIVSVHAFSDGNVPDSKDDYRSQSSAYNTSHVRILTEPVVPQFDVPDDPIVPLWASFLSMLSIISISEFKQEERQRIQEKWNDEYVPSGPAISLSEQIDETTRPVLEEVDVQNKLLNQDVDVEIDVTIEYLNEELLSDDIDSRIDSLIETAGNTI